MKFIDNFLDKITMYRLVLYYLIILLSVALIYSVFGILPFTPISLIFSTTLLLVVCWITNKIFTHAYNAPANVESVYITALILALIISPANSYSGVPVLFWAGVLAMSTKYILAVNQKHIFNPAAVAVVLTSLGFNGSASWWIGTAVMLPFSLLGILIVRKIRRYDLVYYFFLASLITICSLSLIQGSNIVNTLKQIIYSSPIFFFAFVMFTEPLTTPPTKTLQTIYGIITGILYAPQFHIGQFFTTPEIALVIGNIFSYIVSPKYKIVSAIRQKIQIAPDMIDFLFPSQNKFAYTPGQYMEWTLPHKHADSRGNRRYFTIASSPTEDTIRLGVKFYPKGSSFKNAMSSIDSKTIMVGAQLSGDFTLPKNPNQKIVFIAGGIGITPYRSMIKYLIDTKQPRPIILLYANKTADEIVYSDVFTRAKEQLGIKTVYTLTDPAKVPVGWQGKTGRISPEIITAEVPDYKERIFYLSGPHVMVTSYKEVLKNMGIPEKQIKTDFFPGFV